eukprot:31689-Lingulodinium_polyedra.AAC.1
MDRHPMLGVRCARITVHCSRCIAHCSRGTTCTARPRCALHVARYALCITDCSRRMPHRVLLNRSTAQLIHAPCALLTTQTHACAACHAHYALCIA